MCKASLVVAGPWLCRPAPSAAQTRTAVIDSRASVIVAILIWRYLECHDIVTGPYIVRVHGFDVWCAWGPEVQGSGLIAAVRGPLFISSH